MLRIKMTDAIAGNKSWCERARRRHSTLCQQAHALFKQADAIDREITAREKMTRAMEEVHETLPPEETLVFLIPED